MADRVSASGTAGGAPPEITPAQANALIRSRRYVALLVLASIVGVVVSLAAWCFLEGTYQLQQELFVHLPSGLGYHGELPLWYLLVVLGVAGLIVAYAIARLPGRGGHIPVHGLTTGDPARAGRAPGDPAGRGRHDRLRPRARARGAADRPRHGPGDPDGPGHATRGARSGAARRRGRRKLRRAVVHLRLADHRGGDPHRGHRPRRRAAADHSAARAARRRHRQPRLDRHRAR